MKYEIIKVPPGSTSRRHPVRPDPMGVDQDPCSQELASEVCTVKLKKWVRQGFWSPGVSLTGYCSMPCPHGKVFMTEDFDQEAARSVERGDFFDMAPMFRVGDAVEYTRTNGEVRSGVVRQILDFWDKTERYQNRMGWDCRFGYLIEIKEPTGTIRRTLPLHRLRERER